MRPAFRGLNRQEVFAGCAGLVVGGISHRAQARSSRDEQIRGALDCGQGFLEFGGERAGVSTFQAV